MPSVEQFNFLVVVHLASFIRLHSAFHSSRYCRSRSMPSALRFSLGITPLLTTLPPNTACFSSSSRARLRLRSSKLNTFGASSFFCGGLRGRRLSICPGAGHHSRSGSPMSCRNASRKRGRSISSVAAWPEAMKAVTQLFAVLSTEAAGGAFFKFNGVSALSIAIVIFFTHSVFPIATSCPCV